MNWVQPRSVVKVRIKYDRTCQQPLRGTKSVVWSCCVCSVKRVVYTLHLVVFTKPNVNTFTTLLQHFLTIAALLQHFYNTLFACKHFMKPL